MSILLLIATSASAYDMGTLNKLLHLSSVTYCSSANLRPWTCSRCHDSSISDYTLDLIGIDNKQNLQALVGYFNESQSIAVSFRGTIATSIKNWIDDLTFEQIPYDWPGYTGAKVHEGFFHAYHNSLAAQIRQSVQNLKTEHPNAKLLVTGHSLGGAMALICAMDLYNLTRMMPSLYTFGEPRVGNAAFATLITKTIVNATRMTNHNDIVVHIPPEAMNFRHHPLELWIHTTSSSPNTIKECDTSGEDPTCADSVLGDSIGDHLHYLGVPLESGC